MLGLPSYKHMNGLGAVKGWGYDGKPTPENTYGIKIHRAD